ncbi:MAG: hypothetical protein M1816_005374 [Peltula sp. TS41687]|nr:MAG: hypothetical protein M1816_005374 [Peltula sp. TS41687]
MAMVHAKPEAGNHGISVVVFLADDDPSTRQPTPSPFSSRTTTNSSTDQLSESRDTLNPMLPSQSKMSLVESLAEAPIDAVAHVMGNHFGVPHTLPPPSPCTHPLVNRPEAREEYPRGLRPVLKHSKKKDDMDDSVLTSARKKALLMTSSSSPLFRPMTTLSIDSTASLPSPAQIYTKALRVRETTAIEVSAGHRYVQDWGFWLKCYSEGRFNLSRPPVPPPLKPSFTYLSAPLPPNELERIKAFRQLNVPYPDWALKNARHLVILAMRTLQTEHAAISFFDRKNEVMRAECGYNRAVIPRSESIGAHVLLSNEAMVVLDTLKDWRLKKSPLVQDVPFIRFYAAAPLITLEGHIIGAFSVFDSRPKESFSLRLRQKLVNYGRMAIADYQKVINDDHLQQQSQTSLSYQRIADDSHVLHESKSSSASNKSDTGIWWRDEAILPRSDMRQARLTKQISAMSLRGGREGAWPVDGFSSDGQTVVEEMHKSVSRNHVTSNSTHKTYNISPDSPAQRPMPVPRRVQSSLERVLATSKLPTPPDSPTLPQHISIRTTGHEGQSDILSNDKAIPARPDPEEVKRTPKILEPPQPKSFAHRDETGPIFVTPQITPPISQHEYSPPMSGSAEAAEIITLMAQTLGWDFLYVIRILPGYPKEGEASKGEQDKQFTELIVSHGCSDPPPTFSYSLHIQALQSAGGLVYRDNGQDESCNQLGFKVGVMLPLSRDMEVSQLPQAKKGTSGKKSHDSDQSLEETTQSCESGLVLGAFQRTTPSDYEPSAEDIAALRESGYGLRSLLDT